MAQKTNTELEIDDLISFDIVGLFTNVPVEESIMLAAETLYNGKFELPPNDKETFIQLCRLSLTNVIMLTTDRIYVQKEGLAMGSPASPLLANLWLHQFESVFKDRGLTFFRRNVDDILCAIKKIEPDSIQREINALRKNLEFTYELESDMGQIPFLDMLLTHEGNSITSQ